MRVCVITEPLCCTPETNTALEINYTSIKKREINLVRGGKRGSSWCVAANSNCRQDKNDYEFYSLFLSRRSDFTCPGKNLPPFLQCCPYKQQYLVFKFSKLRNSSETELKRSCALSFLFCQEDILIPGGSNI